MSKRIGVIGSGVVGKVLATGFIKHGYEVMIGTRSPEKLEDWIGLNPTGRIGSFEETAKFGETLVLAVSGSVAIEALNQSGDSNLTGKTILDATNPIAQAAPVNGVLSFFTDLNKSLMEKLQTAFPNANFVKCFSCVGNHFMVDPQFAEGKPTMFICGNNDNAKSETKRILNEFGWDFEDLGMVEAARAIEPLCILWCIPGFRENRWNHAYKVLKAQ